MSQFYSHYAPTTKQAVTVETALGHLNPTDNQLANYGIYGGAGALGGAGIGALIELLRNKEDKDYLRASLMGAALGGGLGLGAKTVGDYGLSDSKKDIASLKERIADRSYKAHSKNVLKEQLTGALNEHALDSFRRQFGI
jgi:hypothetical protein